MNHFEISGKNFEFPAGNPYEFTLKPGEQLEKVVLKATDRPEQPKTPSFWSFSSLFKHVLANSFMIFHSFSSFSSSRVVNVRGWRWNYRWSTRSEFLGVEDDVSGAFVDEEFPHEEKSIGKSTTQFSCGTAVPCHELEVCLGRQARQVMKEDDVSTMDFR